MPKFQRHIFICNNERPDDDERGCCAQRGGHDVVQAFKKRLFNAGFKRIVRSNKAGCLDQCSKGVVCVVYPDNVWYGGVSVDDVDEIIREHIVCGRVVERLVIPDEELTGIDPASAASFDV
ncbi:MAG: (2Fe-2S) ferredoxin domain-containing protein [bacterium]|jgi:(2Fe-2S) ferredoxin|nr:(2Fe-2S) ferredoxin domain-containing protein [Planctomycetota bacterium]HIL51079.1 (2Fe-2S) ferredoxin domain-containing protein [Planctomycetota bacterium]